MLKRWLSRVAPPPPEPEGLWPDALGAHEGALAPLCRWALPLGLEGALDVALRQRGLMPAPDRADRWQSPLRVAWTMPLPGAGLDLLVLAGHRLGELVDGLALEAGLPLEEAEPWLPHLQGVAAGSAPWRVYAGLDWGDRCAAEEEQLREHRRVLAESRRPERRVAAAGALARMTLLDRGRWVEHAVVAWEQSTGFADLPFTLLLLHELRWLELAQDPLAPRVRALLAGLAEQDPNLAPLVRRHGILAEPGDEPLELLAVEVPVELAAAAAGLPPEQRAGYAGEARYTQVLAEVADRNTRAELCLEAAEALLARYTPWAPERLAEAEALVLDALGAWPAPSHPVARSRGLLTLARAREAQGQWPARQQALDEAAALMVDGWGRPRDPGLARELLLELDRGP